MSNMSIIDTVWNAPTAEDVESVVQSLGGINAVCRIAKKHRNTVSKWCKGEIKIDYANWKLISEREAKTITRTIEVGFDSEKALSAIIGISDILKKYEVDSDDLKQIEEHIRSAITPK